MAILTLEAMQAEALRVLDEEFKKAYLTAAERAQHRREQVLHILAHKKFRGIFEDEERPI